MFEEEDGYGILCNWVDEGSDGRLVGVDELVVFVYIVGCVIWL